MTHIPAVARDLGMRSSQMQVRQDGEDSSSAWTWLEASTTAR